MTFADARRVASSLPLIAIDEDELSRSLEDA